MEPAQNKHVRPTLKAVQTIFQKVHVRIALSALVIACAGSASAQRGGRGGEPPPPKVVLAEITTGVLAPQSSLPGTVFFKEMAEVATEVSAKVLSVDFEEGQHLVQGQVLITLDSSVLQKNLEAMRATHQRRQTELKDAEVRFERAKDLLEDDVTTPQEYDNLRFAMEGMRHAVSESLADVERLEILIEKHTIRAPFDAVVIDRNTEAGEWKTSGDTVAVIALQGVYDIIVNIPEEYVPFAHSMASLPIAIKGTNINLDGEVITVVQRGDIATRSFPLKLRVEYEGSLYEGMGAIVQVPRSDPTESLIVSRDALLFQDGAFYVYTAEDKTARRHQVTVLGYSGLDAGIQTNELRAGDLIIVKGHERVRPGDQVVIVEDVLSEHLNAGGD